jgi:hypothetical protein
MVGASHSTNDLALTDADPDRRFGNGYLARVLGS